MAAETRAWESTGVREVREARWQQALDRAVARLPTKVRQDARKSAPWKVAVAAHLKETTDVSNSWLAERLGMGSAVYLSKHVGLLHKPGHPALRWLEKIRKVKGKAPYALQYCKILASHEEVEISWPQRGTKSHEKDPDRFFVNFCAFLWQ